MRKLRIGIVDLVSSTSTRSLWARVMYPSFASIMPQAIGVWCQEAGHDVQYVCYVGGDHLADELPADTDMVIIGAFTEAAHLAYALSAQFRSRGVVTVLGGPHARCYPQDAQNYFDYVLGFVDKPLMAEVLAECEPHRPLGVHMTAAGQPSELPSVRERWQFIEPTLKAAPIVKIVPMITSLGCPYHCSFCIDSVVPFKLLDSEILKQDLAFLLTKYRRPLVGFHDPNFGVHFDSMMDAIEEAVPPDRIDFVAESSLSLLSEAHLKRMKRNGVKALLPGIESWYDLGEKSRTGRKQGIEKVREVADHINMILRYIPYLQSNFVLGLDSDHGDEPFELTKRFIDLAPGAFPGFSLLTAFGQAAPLNLEYQKSGRVIPFPFQFLNNTGAMNIKPKNYEWPEFYRRVVDLTRYAFSGRAIYRRAQSTSMMVPKVLNVIRAVSSEGYGRIAYHSEILNRYQTDPQFRPFFESESKVIPDFYVSRVRKDLGAMWDWLPDKTLHHDPVAYMKSVITESIPTAEDRMAI